MYDKRIAAAAATASIALEGLLNRLPDGHPMLQKIDDLINEIDCEFRLTTISNSEEETSFSETRSTLASEVP